MPTSTNQTYRIGNITFIVTPVYRADDQGETMFTILLWLMKADAGNK